MGNENEKPRSTLDIKRISMRNPIDQLKFKDITKNVRLWQPKSMENSTFDDVVRRCQELKSKIKNVLGMHSDFDKRETRVNIFPTMGRAYCSFHPLLDGPYITLDFSIGNTDFKILDTLTHELRHYLDYKAKKLSFTRHVLYSPGVYYDGNVYPVLDRFKIMFVEDYVMYLQSILVSKEDVPDPYKEYLKLYGTLSVCEHNAIHASYLLAMTNKDDLSEREQYMLSTYIANGYDKPYKHPDHNIDLLSIGELDEIFNPGDIGNRWKSWEDSQRSKLEGFTLDDVHNYFSEDHSFMRLYGTKVLPIEFHRIRNFHELLVSKSNLPLFDWFGDNEAKISDKYVDEVFVNNSYNTLVLGYVMMFVGLLKNKHIDIIADNVITPPYSYIDIEDTDELNLASGLNSTYHNQTLIVDLTDVTDKEKNKKLLLKPIATFSRLFALSKLRNVDTFGLSSTQFVTYLIPIENSNEIYRLHIPRYIYLDVQAKFLRSDDIFDQYGEIDSIKLIHYMTSVWLKYIPFSSIPREDRTFIDNVNGMTSSKMDLPLLYNSSILLDFRKDFARGNLDIPRLFIMMIVLSSWVSIDKFSDEAPSILTYALIESEYYRYWAIKADSDAAKDIKANVGYMMKVIINRIDELRITDLYNSNDLIIEVLLLGKLIKLGPIDSTYSYTDFKEKFFEQINEIYIASGKTTSDIDLARDVKLNITKFDRKRHADYERLIDSIKGNDSTEIAEDDSESEIDEELDKHDKKEDGTKKKKSYRD